MLLPGINVGTSSDNVSLVHFRIQQHAPFIILLNILSNKNLLQQIGKQLSSYSLHHSLQSFLVTHCDDKSLQ